MSKTLGAAMFVYNGESQDYCYKETVACMNEFADKVSVVDAGSTDGTAQILQDLQKQYPKMSLVCLPHSAWAEQKGREKLSYFSNLAYDILDTDYFINIQADEILHESCYDSVRKAIETGAEAFLVSRINLWRDCNSQLEVPQNRKPVSTEIIRLAKKGYYSYDDAESLKAQCVIDFVSDIRIYHYGFVRKKEVHPDKIRHMLGEVFLMDVDKKLDGMEVFNPYAWFSDEDVIPIKEPHPKVMEEWVKTRP